MSNSNVAARLAECCQLLFDAMPTGGVHSNDANMARLAGQAASDAEDLAKHLPRDSRHRDDLEWMIETAGAIEDKCRPPHTPSLPGGISYLDTRLTDAVAALRDRAKLVALLMVGGPAAGQTNRRRGGSKPQHDATADSRIAADYKASGQTRKDFAQARGTSYQKVKAALDRHRKRRN